MSVTSDNASDMCYVIQRMHVSLSRNQHIYFPFPESQIRCIAHVVNLAVKESLKVLHSNITCLGKFSSAIRPSTKQRDLYEQLQVEVNDRNAHLPTLDVGTRLSSSFHMIQSAFKAISILNATCHRITELSEYSIDESEWNRIRQICAFLEYAASITNNQSGVSFVTLNLTATAFRLLLKKCREQCTHDVLGPIVAKMLSKLEAYKNLVCSRTAE